jgi:hypothetical protein
MNILDVSERDELLEGLSIKQKEFIEFYVKRGKKTSFANVLALDKGIVLPESATIEEMEMLLDDWVLDDYIDNGFVNPETPCECGKPLRYQYIVRHLSTNQVRRFGITHFEEHTGLPASIISTIKKGFTQIDYERDELLSKIRDGWSLLEHFSSIPNDLKLAKDIQQHLEADIPLLDRQINRLKRDFLSYLDKREEYSKYNQGNSTNNINETSNVTLKSFEEQDSFEFFENNTRKSSKPNQIPQRFEEQVSFFEHFENSSRKTAKPNQISQKFNFQDTIIRYLEEGVESARIICELLIKNHNIENKRYLTGKPRIYVEVCQYLEGLVKEGELFLAEVIGKEDRVYQKVRKVN